MINRPQLQAIASELETIAQKHHVSAVIAEARRLGSTDDTLQLLIVSDPSQNPSGLQRWLESSAQGYDLRLEVLENTVTDSVATIAADKVVIILPAKQRLLSPEVEKIVSVINSRYPRSIAIVFDSTHLSDPTTELADLERSAWLLFAPEPKTRWNNQDLTESGIYFWSDEAQSGPTQQRLDTYRHGLQSWLNEPFSAAERRSLPLLGHQLLQLINLVEDQNEKSETAATPIPSESQDLAKALAALKILGPRLKRLISEESESTIHAQCVALDLLEQNLIREVSEELPRLWKQRHDTPELNFKMVTRPYIEARIKTWAAENQPRWENRAKDFQAEIEALIKTIDWSAINRALAESGAQAAYSLHWDPIGFKIDMPVSGPSTAEALTERPPLPLQSATWAATGALGGGSVVAFCLGGPILGATLAAAGLVLAGINNSALLTSRRVEELSKRVRQSIHEAVTMTKDQVRAEAVSRAEAEIARLEIYLSQINALGSSRPSKTPPDPTTAALDRLREQVLQLSAL